MTSGVVCLDSSLATLVQNDREMRSFRMTEGSVLVQNDRQEHFHIAFRMTEENALRQSLMLQAARLRYNLLLCHQLFGIDKLEKYA